MAKVASLLVKVGALIFIIFVPVPFALQFQLLGGLWIIQILPALVFGLRWIVTLRGKSVYTIL